MAIQFARIEIVGRSSGGNACCKGAYNARAIVKDNKTNITYNFKHKGDNVYHTVLLPEHADKRFNSVAEFMNEVEHCEKRKDSQLLKDIVLALPDDKELTLQDRINITHLLIEKRAWVKEGLGVQVDIHEPHDGEKNWHAHLLVTTRRFTEDGQSFGLKATDLNPEFKKVGGKSFAIPEAEQIHEDLRDIINDYFKMLGLENRVDAISQLGQEHVGPVRMRSVLNKAVLRNEERREANIEHLNSAEALLERVVANKSVFTANDIKRELKCINDSDRRNTLLNEALGHSSIVHLSDHNGNDTGLVTTKEVRAEEQKILRLAGYVANGENVITAKSKSKKGNDSLLSQMNNSLKLTQEQTDALKYLLQNDNGVRILQGRAGTGKSHVLGKVCSISESMGINVIGIAPTHKARTELSKVGYEKNDTVKGMLFKLHNSRFSLPKNSLIVVDEAGMVANSDYQELMRIAATRKCNIILAGDSRQLSSVSRGGMFEVLADKFGSCEIANIQRQNENWGREVAMCLSCGDARAGLSILQQEGRIKWAFNSEESMGALLLDWQNSRIPLADKIIIAVENKNVDALNAGARQYLKASGYLVGDEYSIAGREFMRGDRVLITKTDKSLGVTNGDIGALEYANSNKFVLSLGSGKDVKHVEFDPNEYNGFRHGYATTVFKAQGASIKDVYVFHDGFSGMRNSYVALSRHVEELKLYANEKATYDMDALVKQMSRKLDKGSSLAYLTQEEVLQKEQESNTPKGLFGSIVDSAKRGVRTFMDKHLPESEYYNYKEPAREILPVEKVINDVATLQEKVAVGDNASAISNSAKSSPEASKPSYNSSISNAKYDMQPIWDRENIELRHNIKFKAEFITKDLLGEPNRKLSNGKELRYGEHGKLAVRIGGEKSGTWYDFSESKGGDMFSLVQHTKSSDFKEAADYLRSSVGMVSSARPNLQLVYDHESRDNFTDAHKAKKAQEAEDRQKIKYTNDLHARSKDINSKNVAHRYLTSERGITCDLGTDIKTAGIYDKGAGKNFPALVAFARNSEGNITGGQRLLLDGKTGTKANVDIARKSFGSISGSFVEISQPNNEKGNFTIIAEGLETALSVNQSLREHNNITNGTKVKLLCSLGISNIKNYSPSKAEKIIIAADNDRQNAITAKTIENAKAELQAKGAIVEIVRPEVQGDFNDMLKSGNSREISQIFTPAIERHTATTVNEYIGACGKDRTIALNDEQKSQLSYIESYNVDQNKIVDSFRKSDLRGTLELGNTYKKLFLAEQNLNKCQPIIDKAKGHNITINSQELRQQLVDNARCNPEELCINSVLGQFANKKEACTKVNDMYSLIKQEDKFLSSIKPENKIFESKILEERIEQAHNGKSIEIISSIKSGLESCHKQGIISDKELGNKIQTAGYDLNKLNTDLNNSVQEGRDKHLYYASLEMKELDKLGVKYDKDSWVRDLKNIQDYMKVKDYAQNKLGIEAKKHLEPTFLKLEQQRLNAGNFWQFLNVVAKEQATFVELKEKYRFAISAIDKVNGNLNYRLATSHACDLGGEKGRQSAISLIGYAAKNNIVSEKQIRDDINNRSGDINNIHGSIKSKCDAINEKKAEQYKAKQQEIERQNQQQKDKDNDRGMGGMSL